MNVDGRLHAQPVEEVKPETLKTMISILAGWGWMKDPLEQWTWIITPNNAIKSNPAHLRSQMQEILGRVLSVSKENTTINFTMHVGNQPPIHGSASYVE